MTISDYSHVKLMSSTGAKMQKGGIGLFTDQLALMAETFTPTCL